MSNNLNSFFKPKSVVLVGASSKVGSVGWAISKNLLAWGKGKVFFVNPNRKTIFGRKSYSTILKIKENIDLAIIAVPREIVPLVADDCRKKKVGGAIVISSGFSEGDSVGRKLSGEIKNIFDEAGIKFLGPNCLGIINPYLGLNSSFAPLTPPKGGIAFLSQSGAIIDLIMGKLSVIREGFSSIVSYGNETGIKLNELLDYFANDKKTKVISIYLEGVKKGQKFVESLKRASVKKPVIILKGGKTKIGNRAIQSHTASLNSQFEVYSAAFRKGGAIEVQTIDELTSTSFLLSHYDRIKNNQTIIITNGGAFGVLAADWLGRFSIKIVNFSISDKKKFQAKFPRLKLSNPLDLLGDALADRYQESLDFVHSLANVKTILLIESMQMMTEPVKTAKIIIRWKNKYSDKKIIPVFLGENEKMKKARKILLASKIPVFRKLELAVLALKNILE